MVMSGLQIYNASPLFAFDIPEVFTLGGWLAGARMWHFLGMWLFAVNGIVWVAYNVISRHGRTTTIVRKSDLPGILPMVKYYLRIQKVHPPVGKYNPLQKLTYTVIPILGLCSILSGIGIYLPVQFSRFSAIFGGYDQARVWHFVFTMLFLGFLAGHLVMVALAGWSNFVSMITGWKRTEAGAHSSK
jgi:thiosulfate reductase cytochrome b subunit